MTTLVLLIAICVCFFISQPLDKSPFVLYNESENILHKRRTEMQNISINANFNNVLGKVKPMHAVNNMPTLPNS